MMTLQISFTVILPRPVYSPHNVFAIYHHQFALSSPVYVSISTLTSNSQINKKSIWPALHHSLPYNTLHVSTCCRSFPLVVSQMHFLCPRPRCRFCSPRRLAGPRIFLQFRARRPHQTDQFRLARKNPEMFLNCDILWSLSGPLSWSRSHPFQHQVDIYSSKVAQFVRTEWELFFRVIRPVKFAPENVSADNNSKIITTHWRLFWNNWSTYCILTTMTVTLVKSFFVTIIISSDALFYLFINYKLQIGF